MTLPEFFSLLGGVGMFLYGMSIMSIGLKEAAGSRLRSILEKATANRFAAVAVGILVTLLIQSSSATDMMVISFVNSSLLPTRSASSTRTSWRRLLSARISPPTSPMN